MKTTERLLITSIKISAQNIGYLSVSVDPGVEVFLDSTLISNESFSDLALNTGTYELLILDTHNFSWNQRAIKEFVQILADREVIKNLASRWVLRFTWVVYYSDKHR